ncbi:MAG: hypothetical protein QM679_13065 [Patulibacter sp.]
MHLRLPQHPLLVLALFVAGGFGAAVARGSSTPTADEVAAKIHDDVGRDVLSRTGDFTATVGPLDCVELGSGVGSCLANLTSSTHRADHVMVAVHYEIATNGQVTWQVRLP